MNQTPSSPDHKRSEILETLKRIVKYLEIAVKLNGVLVGLFGISLAALLGQFLLFLGGITASYLQALVLTAPLTVAVAFIVGAWDWKKEFNPLGFCVFSTAVLLAATYISQKSGLGTPLSIHWPTDWNGVLQAATPYLSNGAGGIAKAPIDLLTWYFHIYPKGSFLVSAGTGALVGAVFRK